MQLFVGLDEQILERVGLGEFLEIVAADPFVKAFPTDGVLLLGFIFRP
jgi:hypothetical protein